MYCQKKPTLLDQLCPSRRCWCPVQSNWKWETFSCRIFSLHKCGISIKPAMAVPLTHSECRKRVGDRQSSPHHRLYPYLAPATRFLIENLLRNARHNSWARPSAVPGTGQQLATGNWNWNCQFWFIRQASGKYLASEVGSRLAAIR